MCGPAQLRLTPTTSTGPSGPSAKRATCPNSTLPAGSLGSRPESRHCRSKECQNGEVTEWINAPISCDEWQGQCPSWQIYTCTQGCTVDPSRIDDFMVAAEVLCEETPNKQPGDPCPTGRSTECLPSRATINPDQAVTNHYLLCDSTTYTCVVGEPPQVSRWLAACDSEVDAFVGSGLSGFFFGYSCSICVFADDQTRAVCVRDAAFSATATTSARRVRFAAMTSSIATRTIPANGWACAYRARQGTSPICPVDRAAPSSAGLHDLAKMKSVAGGSSEWLEVPSGRDLPARGPTTIGRRLASGRLR